MPRKLLTISFIGTGYHGWQVQKNGRSVQQTVCEAMYRLYGNSVAVTGCSRTDAGVHALKYCFHFDDTKGYNDINIVKALNMYLPDDIAVMSSATVPDDFHARYSCKSKTYMYKIYEGFRDPFLEGRAYNYKRHLDLDKMNFFAEGLLGRNDFKSFCASGSSVENTVRNLTKCQVYKDGNIIKILLSADGFLYNMVRIIAGTLVAVSEGRISENSAKDIINLKDRNMAGPTLPACGLYLCDVLY